MGSLYIGGDLVAPALVNNIETSSLFDSLVDRSITEVKASDLINVTSIGAYAFSNCTKLVNVTIPNHITIIGDSAFYFCRNLKSIVIPSSVVAIEDHAFSFTGITNITIPGTVERIGNSAFSNSNITIAIISNGVKIIDKWAFNNCKELINIEIPNTITSIGSYMLSFSTKLTNITYKGTKAQWNAITKDNDWNKNSSVATITCTDGTITL